MVDITEHDKHIKIIIMGDSATAVIWVSPRNTIHQPPQNQVAPWSSWRQSEHLLQEPQTHRPQQQYWMVLHIELDASRTEQADVKQQSLQPCDAIALQQVQKTALLAKLATLKTLLNLRCVTVWCWCVVNTSMPSPAMTKEKLCISQRKCK